MLVFSLEFFVLKDFAVQMADALSGRAGSLQSVATQFSRARSSKLILLARGKRLVKTDSTNGEAV
jgi:hypothetical protein